MPRKIITTNPEALERRHFYSNNLPSFNEVIGSSPRRELFVAPVFSPIEDGRLNYYPYTVKKIKRFDDSLDPDDLAASSTTTTATFVSSVIDIESVASSKEKRTKRKSRNPKPPRQRPLLSPDFQPELWVKRFKRTSYVKDNKLFLCFPGFAESAQTFRKWSKLFDHTGVRFCSIAMPNRHDRMDDPGPQSLIDICHHIYESLRQLRIFSSLPKACRIVFFGHGLGAVIAFEILRLARKDGYMVSHFITSSSRSPDEVSANNRELFREQFANATNREAIELLDRLGGICPLLKERKDLAPTFAQLIRADMKLYENYYLYHDTDMYEDVAVGDDREMSKDDFPGRFLDIPFTVVGAADDAYHKTGDFRAGWFPYTDSDIRNWYIFPRGGHSCLHDEAISGEFWQDVIRRVVIRDEDDLSEYLESVNANDIFKRGAELDGPDDNADGDDGGDFNESDDFTEEREEH